MEAPARPSDRATWLVEGLLFLGVILLAVKVTYDVARVRDVLPGDEPSYMYNGSLIPTQGLPSAQYSPLYSLWYYCLSHLQPDAVRLYFFNWSLLVVLQTVSLYLLVRSLGGGRAAALLTVTVVLTSNLFDVWPYLMHLATALLAAGAVLAVRARSWTLRWLILSLTFLLVAYVRPELYLGFLACAGIGFLVGLTMLWQRRVRPAALVVAALAITVSGAALGWGVGLPLGGRSFVAFGQHYAAHVAEAQQTLNSPMVRWEDFVRADFGDAETLAQAVRANPQAILWHVGLNASALPRALQALLMPQPRLLPWLLTALQLMLAVAALVAFVGLARRLRSFRSEADGGWAVILITCALVVGLSLVSALAIFPRQHYLMPIGFFSAVLLGASLPRFVRLERWPALLLLFLTAWALTPNRAHGWDAARWLAGTRPPPAMLQEQGIAATLRRLPLRSSIVFLDYFTQSRAVFAGLPVRFVSPTAKHEPFDRFVRDNDVSVIVLDPVLCYDSAYRDDPEFQALALAVNPGEFTLVVVPRTYVRLAIRNDVLTGPVLNPGSSDTDPESAYFLRILHEVMHRKD